MLEWFFHLWWYYILSKPYEKYENMKIKKNHPLLCQKKLPPPLLSYSSHFWLMIETNKSARMFSCCRVRVLKSVSWTLTLESVPVNQLLLHACADSLLSMLGIAKKYTIKENLKTFWRKDWILHLRKVIAYKYPSFFLLYYSSVFFV